MPAELRLLITPWFKNRCCVGWWKDHVDISEISVCGWGVPLLAKSTTILFWALKVELSTPPSTPFMHYLYENRTKHSFLCTPQKDLQSSSFFLISVLARNLLNVFEAPWLFGLTNKKQWQFLPICNCSCLTCYLNFDAFRSRTFFSPAKW